MSNHKKNVYGRYMQCDESPFLDSGGPQGWLAPVELALKCGSELLMLPESRNISRIYSARKQEWGILSWRCSMSLKFQRNDRPYTGEVTSINGKFAGPGIKNYICRTLSNSPISKLMHSALEPSIKYRFPEFWHQFSSIASTAENTSAVMQSLENQPWLGKTVVETNSLFFFF